VALSAVEEAAEALVASEVVVAPAPAAETSASSAQVEGLPAALVGVALEELPEAGSSVVEAAFATASASCETVAAAFAVEVVPAAPMMEASWRASVAAPRLERSVEALVSWSIGRGQFRLDAARSQKALEFLVAAAAPVQHAHPRDSLLQAPLEALLFLHVF